MTTKSFQIYEKIKQYLISKGKGSGIMPGSFQQFQMLHLDHSCKSKDDTETFGLDAGKIWIDEHRYSWLTTRSRMGH